MYYMTIAIFFDLAFYVIKEINFSRTPAFIKEISIFPDVLC